MPRWYTQWVCPLHAHIVNHLVISDLPSQTLVWHHWASQGSHAESRQCESTCTKLTHEYCLLFYSLSYSSSLFLLYCEFIILLLLLFLLLLFIFLLFLLLLVHLLQLTWTVASMEMTYKIFVPGDERVVSYLPLSHIAAQVTVCVRVCACVRVCVCASV